MILSKIQAYCIGLLLFTAPFWGYKLYWLANSQKINGVVLGIRDIWLRGSRQTYPVIQYETDGHITVVDGDWNLPYKQGDPIPIRFQKSDLTNIHLNTFLGIWIDTLMWCSIIFLVFTISFLIPDIVPKDARFQVAGYRVRILTNDTSWS